VPKIIHMTIWAFAAVAPIIFGAPAIAGELKNYKDWVVGCDNWLDCRANSFPSIPDDGSGGSNDHLEIVIRRQGAPITEPEIELRFGDMLAQDIARISQLVVDGGRTPNSRIPLRSSKEEVVVSGSDALRLIEAMREGQILSVQDDQRRPIATTSLQGLKAALLHMDAEQHRIGTVTALARSGTSPAETIPPNPSPAPIMVPQRSPKSPVVLGEAALAPLRAKDSCLAYSNGDQPAEKPKADFFRLDAVSTLLILATTCGGYNPSSQIYIVDEQGRTQPATMHGPKLDFDGQTDGLTGAWWDDGSSTLGSFFRGRGAGDCGEEMRFAWDGTRFVLTLDREMLPCRGSFDLITTFRLDVAVSPVP